MANESKATLVSTAPLTMPGNKSPDTVRGSIYELAKTTLAKIKTGQDKKLNPPKKNEDSFDRMNREADERRLAALEEVVNEHSSAADIIKAFYDFYRYAQHPDSQIFLNDVLNLFLPASRDQRYRNLFLQEIINISDK